MFLENFDLSRYTQFNLFLRSAQIPHGSLRPDNNGSATKYTSDRITWYSATYSFRMNMYNQWANTFI